jgi:hypothetical protein
MPAHEPRLTWADPSGATEGTAIPVAVEQEVRFADGSWDLVIVRSQAADRSGGRRVLLRWYQDVSEHEGWSLIRTSSDRDKFRELPPELRRGHSRLASLPGTDPADSAASRPG